MSYIMDFCNIIDNRWDIILPNSIYKEIIIKKFNENKLQSIFYQIRAISYEFVE